MVIVAGAALAVVCALVLGVALAPVWVARVVVAAVDAWRWRQWRR